MSMKSAVFEVEYRMFIILISVSLIRKKKHTLHEHLHSIKSMKRADSLNGLSSFFRVCEVQ